MILTIILTKSFQICVILVLTSEGKFFRIIDFIRD
jgi:hypothetical protein